MADSDDVRPPRENRLLSDRFEPAVITIRTRFAYDGPDARSTRSPRVDRYRSDITECGEFSSHTPQYDHVGDVFQRMVAAFGDDSDLEVVIRRADPNTAGTDPAVQVKEQRSRMTATATIGDAATAAARADSFAAQLNRLFDTIYPPGRGPYTSAELIEWVDRGGMRLSAPYLSQLRTGDRRRPSQYTIELIAEFFGIDSEYFADPGGSYTRWLETELGWLDLAHNPDVRRLTTMLTDLHAETRERLMTAAGI